MIWEKAEEFDSRLSAHFNIGGDGQTAQSCLWYDAECCLGELSFDMMSWFSHLEPFGTNWEALVLRVRDLKITGVRELRGGHYKLEVTGRENSHHRLDALWFSPPSQHAFFKSILWEKIR